MDEKKKALNVDAKPFIPNVNAAIFLPSLITDSKHENSMPAISKLPEEMLVQIFSLLPCRDLLSVEKTCKQWADLCKNNINLEKVVPKAVKRIKEMWPNGDYFPSKEEIGDALSLGISLKLLYYSLPIIVKLKVPTESFDQF